MSGPDFGAILTRHLERTDYRGDFIGCSCWDAGLPAVTNHREHLAEVLAAEVTIWLAGQRERIAEALSCGEVGEMTRYIPTAVPDHNRWSWQGDGHGLVLFEQYRRAADQVLDALCTRAALDAASAPVSAQQDHDGTEGQGEGCETCRGEVWCPICEDRREAALPPLVHNHLPYRPPCAERVVDGQLRGACLNDDGSPR